VEKKDDHEKEEGEKGKRGWFFSSPRGGGKPDGKNER